MSSSSDAADVGAVAEAIAKEQGEEGHHRAAGDVDVEGISRYRLSVGFRALRHHRDVVEARNAASSPVVRLRELTPAFLSCALVHFVDPTSASGSISAAASNTGGGGGKTNLQLYPKLAAIFASEYGSTLRNVPYRHFRSGVGGVIDSLPVQPFVTKSALLLNTDPIPWSAVSSDGGGGGTGDFLSVTAGDPSEWHTTPYCHVYLAACGSLEEYRTKVKPSIQAFVSQIESTAAPAGGTRSNNNSGHGAAPSPRDAAASHGGSSRYVIVFVPTGDHAAPSDEGSRLGSGIGARWTSRVAAAGRRMKQQHSSEIDAAAAAANTNTNSNSGHGAAPGHDAGEGGGGGGGSEALNTSTTSAGSIGSGVGVGGKVSLTAHLSKVDREIARRFAADFPDGNVCTLSTLATVATADGSVSSNEQQLRELQKLEWSELLRCLGAGVGDGFRDRCQRYDDEIRQQDSLRAMAVATATSSSSSSSDRARVQYNRQAQKFDLVYFFLLKESLAFTYEQMCLPSEALLQYDELRAVLPDVDVDGATSYSGTAGSGDDLARIAIRGDSVGFRKRIRSLDHLNKIAPVLQQYLLSRETVLLFKMNNAVVVAQRCMMFVTSMYDFKTEQLRIEAGNSSKDADADEKKEKEKRRVEVERWAFEFCWDVKSACDIYLADDVSESQTNGDTDRPNHKDQSLARYICELLEFARLRLVNIGDAVLEENPIRSRVQVVDKVLFKEWKPWRPRTSNEDESFHEEDYEPASKDDFVEDAIRSSDAFLTRYLELLKVMLGFNRFSGRRRCAACLGVEVAGIYVVKGNPERATIMLREAAEVYAQDRWQSCHFMVLFRLAAYQREVSTADDYVDTLVQCFSPAHTKLAPTKALAFLEADLEAILRSSLVSRTRLTSKPIFEPLLGLESYKVTARAGSARDLLKKVYSVGECASVTLALTSFLPKEIEIEEIAIDLVPFQSYIAAMEDSTVCKDNDVFHALRREGPIKICKGVNDFTFDWVPMVSGQYIISSTTIKWKGVRFFYHTKDQKRPTIRIDVVPSEPTHSIRLTPDYLVPGHEQPVKFSFLAGSDIVKVATLKLSCSNGLLLSLPSNRTGDTDEKWTSSGETTLPSCGPGSTHDVTILVKPNDGSDESKLEPESPQSLRASVSTSFRCPYPEGKGDASKMTEEMFEDSYMDHTMGFQVCTLPKQLLTVEGMEAVPFALDRAVLNVCLQCNAPAPITVRKWNIALPPFVALSKDGDFNACLVDSRIIPGERIFMAFDCAYAENVSPDTTAAPDVESHLTVEIENEYGQIFQERLHLDLKRPTTNRALLPKTLKPVVVEVKPSTLQGLTGAPITLLYMMNTTELFSSLSSLSGSVHYQLSFDSADWIMSGRTEGQVQKEPSAFEIEFLAIPARPGVLEHYPSLLLYYQGSSGGADSKEQAPSKESPATASNILLTPLEAVDLVTPDPFRSEAPQVYTTVAVPVQQTAISGKQTRGGSLKA